MKIILGWILIPFALALIDPRFFKIWLIIALAQIIGAFTLFAWLGYDQARLDEVLNRHRRKVFPVGLAALAVLYVIGIWFIQAYKVFLG